MSSDPSQLADKGDAPELTAPNSFTKGAKNTMSTGLFIEVGYRYPFGPNISDCVVLVNLDDASESRAIEITMPNLAEIQITSVLSALRRFFEGEQFRSIDFDKGEMLVEHRDKADYVSFVPARGGLLREDGIVEFAYDGPHK